MEWTDEAVVLSARSHGEGGAIVQLLTAERGRHAGLVQGSRKLAPLLQPGMQVRASWRARLAEHLGRLSLEPLGSLPGGLFDDPARLAAVQAACALCEILPERAPQPAIHAGLVSWLGLLDNPYWAAAYIRFELGLLAALGFGLDLQRCGASGANDQLTHVSPRTGRAVSRSAAEPYLDRLLPLPGFLVGRGAPDAADLADGLDLTGHFLARWVYGAADRDLPAARHRLGERMRRDAHRKPASARLADDSTPSNETG